MRHPILLALVCGVLASACVAGPRSRARPNEDSGAVVPPTSARGHGASELRRVLQGFAATSARHRAAEPRALDAQLDNWAKLLSRLEVLDGPHASGAPPLRDDLLLARAVLDEELARDAATWPELPRALTERIYDRMGRLVLLLAQAESTAMTPDENRRPSPGLAEGASALLPSLEWPLHPVVVTSPFGDRVHPVRGQWATHRGVDLLAEGGQPVHAAAPGRVVAAGWNGALGLHVEVDHGDGLRTRYGHLSRVLVAAGGTLVRGQAVGLAGDTGEVTGIHLHFEVWRGSHPVDPLRELPPADAALAAPRYSSLTTDGG